ncbi:MAG: hypothetical protein NZ988_03420 [Thaumarchaeota archaeon]|nr:hypothetical protein [Candidatus Calditenuaceae archaeon]MDW8187082.1 V4R domain-containing protein [Nitrososphaerota archaeon]
MSYEMPLLFYHPGRRLVTISLVVEGGAKAIAGVMGYLSVKGVKVLGIMSWIPPVNGNLIGLNVIADLSELRESLSEVVCEISLISEVRGLNIYEAELRGMASCVKGGFPSFLGERLFIMPQALFKELYLTFYEALGASAFAIMRQAGRRVGEFAGAFKALVGDVIGLIQILREASNALGLASDIRVVSSDDEVIKIIVKDLADCASISEVKPETRTGYFFAGVLEALFRQVGDEEFIVEEVECINTGSAFCVFEIRQIQKR